MTIFTKVNIALEGINIHLSQTPRLQDTFDKLTGRQVISKGLQYEASKPDLTFHMYTEQSQHRAIAVGDIKLYAKWSHDRWKSDYPQDRIDFGQVLAQINYYMRKRQCLFAVVINEVECTVCLSRSRLQGSAEAVRTIPNRMERRHRVSRRGNYDSRFRYILLIAVSTVGDR